MFHQAHGLKSCDALLKTVMRAGDVEDFLGGFHGNLKVEKTTPHCTVNAWLIR